MFLYTTTLFLASKLKVLVVTELLLVAEIILFTTIEPALVPPLLEVEICTLPPDSANLLCISK